MVGTGQDKEQRGTRHVGSLLIKLTYGHGWMDQAKEREGYKVEKVEQNSIIRQFTGQTGTQAGSMCERVIACVCVCLYV